MAGSRGVAPPLLLLLMLAHRFAVGAQPTAADAPAPAPALPPPPPRHLYLIRHGEAAKNLGAKKSSAGYDSLTALGRAQAAAAAARLCGPSWPAPPAAIVSAPEQRCQDTALAVTSACGLAVPAVDANLTSSRPGESPQQRADRALGAVLRFLASTAGGGAAGRGIDVSAVAHGHVINLLLYSALGAPTAGADAQGYESAGGWARCVCFFCCCPAPFLTRVSTTGQVVNAGVAHLLVPSLDPSTWMLLDTDPLVYDGYQ